jgi:hypothetical protein
LQELNRGADDRSPLPFQKPDCTHKRAAASYASSKAVDRPGELLPEFRYGTLFVEADRIDVADLIHVESVPFDGDLLGSSLGCRYIGSGDQA